LPEGGRKYIFSKAEERTGKAGPVLYATNNKGSSAQKRLHLAFSYSRGGHRLDRADWLYSHHRK